MTCNKDGKIHKAIKHCSFDEENIAQLLEKERIHMHKRAIYRMEEARCTYHAPLATKAQIYQHYVRLDNLAAEARGKIESKVPQSAAA